jgi:histone H3/H4
LKISKATIKKIVAGNTRIKISDDAAAKIAEVLERKAKKIAEHAVSRAKKKNRNIVMLEDIEDYKLTHGD